MIRAVTVHCTEDPIFTLIPFSFLKKERGRVFRDISPFTNHGKIFEDLLDGTTKVLFLSNKNSCSCNYNYNSADKNKQSVTNKQ